jgi:hypothetical protein
MTLLFIDWIFIQAPTLFLKSMQQISSGIIHYFSLPGLFSSLFAPWRHDAVPLNRVPASLWFRIVVNNTVSRLIGFFVRSLTILTGITLLIIWNFSLVIFIICWYFLPLILGISIVYGIRLLIGI